MIQRVVAMLRPSPRSVVALAQRETDPAAVAGFEPILLGPVMTLVALVAIGVAGIVVAPFRLIGRLVRRT